MATGNQIHEGWIPVPDHYDDGGFPGGNMGRSALRHLMADIEAGKVDIVRRIFDDFVTTRNSDNVLG